MRLYSLYNKRLDKKLNHPRVGVWYTANLTEAEDMLKACLGYVGTIGVEGYAADFVIVDTISGEEIQPCQHPSGAVSPS